MKRDRKGKTIKIFLASSIKLMYERSAIGAQIQIMNQILQFYSIYIDLFECEYDISTSILNQSQHYYDKEIQESNLIFVIKDGDMGPYTFHELRTAIESERVQQIELLIKNLSSIADPSIAEVKDMISRISFCNNSSFDEEQSAEEDKAVILKSIISSSKLIHTQYYTNVETLIELTQSILINYIKNEYDIVLDSADINLHYQIDKLPSYLPETYHIIKLFDNSQELFSSSYWEAINIVRVFNNRCHLKNLQHKIGIFIVMNENLIHSPEEELPRYKVDEEILIYQKQVYDSKLISKENNEEDLYESVFALPATARDTLTSISDRRYILMQRYFRWDEGIDSIIDEIRNNKEDYEQSMEVINQNRSTLTKINALDEEIRWWRWVFAIFNSGTLSDDTLSFITEHIEVYNDIVRYCNEQRKISGLYPREELDVYKYIIKLLSKACDISSKIEERTYNRDDNHIKLSSDIGKKSIDDYSAEEEKKVREASYREYNLIMSQLSLVNSIDIYDYIEEQESICSVLNELPKLMSFLDNNVTIEEIKSLFELICDTLTSFQIQYDDIAEHLFDLLHSQMRLLSTRPELSPLHKVEWMDHQTWICDQLSFVKNIMNSITGIYSYGILIKYIDVLKQTLHISKQMAQYSPLYGFNYLCAGIEYVFCCEWIGAANESLSTICELRNYSISHFRDRISHDTGLAEKHGSIIVNQFLFLLIHCYLINATYDELDDKFFNIELLDIINTFFQDETSSSDDHCMLSALQRYYHNEFIVDNGLPIPKPFFDNGNSAFGKYHRSIKYNEARSYLNDRLIQILDYSIYTRGGKLTSFQSVDCYLAVINILSNTFGDYPYQCTPQTYCSRNSTVSYDFFHFVLLLNCPDFPIMINQPSFFQSNPDEYLEIVSVLFNLSLDYLSYSQLNACISSLYRSIILLQHIVIYFETDGDIRDQSYSIAIDKYYHYSVILYAIINDERLIQISGYDESDDYFYKYLNYINHYLQFVIDAFDPLRDIDK